MCIESEAAHAHRSPPSSPGLLPRNPRTAPRAARMPGLFGILTCSCPAGASWRSRHSSHGRRCSRPRRCSHRESGKTACRQQQASTLLPCIAWHACRPGMPAGHCRQEHGRGEVHLAAFRGRGLDVLFAHQDNLACIVGGVVGDAALALDAGDVTWQCKYRFTKTPPACH